MSETKNRPRVAMLLSSGYGPEVRVQKEAHTLAAAGYRVTVIAWDRVHKFPRHMRESAPESLGTALSTWSAQANGGPAPVSIVRVQVPAGYRTGRRLLAKIPLFWWRLLQEIRRVRPDVVHANDLDTLPVAYLYHRLTGTPVVYDAREYYPGMVQANVGGWLSDALDRLDHWLAPRAGAVLTVGDRLETHYRAMGAHAWVVHNSQPLPDRSEMAQAGQLLRESLGMPEGALLVVYVGALAPDRLLTPLLDAVSALPDVWFAVGGAGPTLPLVQAAAERCDRIKVLGWVPLGSVPSVVAAGDVVYYGLDADCPNSYYFMPNLAFYAMAVGRPLLTTPIGEVAEMVCREECGIVMESSTRDAAINALRRLGETNYRQKLANRAQYLGETRYNWLLAAQQLVNAYSIVRTERIVNKL